jgi:acetoin utilization protein AcuB
MTRDVVVVGPDCSLATAWTIMQARRIRHLPVVQAGKLVGILSDRDVLRWSPTSSEAQVEPSAQPVALAMTSSPLTCGPNERISELARMMIEQKIDAVPVVSREQKLVGLVTSSDLLSLLIEHAATRVLPFEFRVYDGERLAAVA